MIPQHHLKQTLDNDRLTFADMAQLVPPIAQFVNRFVGTQAFVLQDTTIIVDIAPSAITIKGKSKANHRGTVIFRLRGSSLVTSS